MLPQGSTRRRTTKKFFYEFLHRLLRRTGVPLHVIFLRHLLSSLSAHRGIEFRRHDVYEKSGRNGDNRDHPDRIGWRYGPWSCALLVFFLGPGIGSFLLFSV
jgi:hypothetical protein